MPGTTQPLASPPGVVKVAQDFVTPVTVEVSGIPLMAGPTKLPGLTNVTVPSPRMTPTTERAIECIGVGDAVAVAVERRDHQLRRHVDSGYRRERLACLDSLLAHARGLYGWAHACASACAEAVPVAAGSDMATTIPAAIPTWRPSRPTAVQVMGAEDTVLESHPIGAFGTS